MLAAVSARADGGEDFTAAMTGLSGTSFVAKAAAVEAIEKSGNPRAPVVLQALLDGKLYAQRTDARIVIAEQNGENLAATDAASGEPLGEVPAAALSRIVINNQMRTSLGGSIARLSFSSPDAAVRRSAVIGMAADPRPETVGILREARVTEPNAEVREAMAVVLALSDSLSSEAATRREAVTALGESMLPEARNRLAAMVEEGGESEPAVREAARSALAAIEARYRYYALFETLFFGLSLGFVLVLASTGLAITFGVMGVINMAHGELMMLGAYTTYVIQVLMPEHLDASLFVAIPAAFVVSALAGVAIERGVVRFLYGRPLETLLATFGISLFLQQLVRSIFSPLNRSVITPSWMSGQLQLSNALSLTYNRLYIIVFSILVFSALLLVLKRTSLGLQVRAVAQNRAMAKAMGVRTDWVDAATFGLGSGVAGVAGVALSQLTNVGPNLGQAYIVDTFMVVVFGGVGNLWGTLVGGLSLGVASKFAEPYVGAVLAKIFVLVFIILFIQRKPRGLFPQRGRSAEA